MKKTTRILTALGAAAMVAGFSLPASAQTRANFSVYDRNGNGVITQQEFDQVRAQRMGGGKRALSFAQMDTNRDGLISRTEYANAHKNSLRPGQRKGAMLGQGQGQGMGRGAAADAPRPQPGVGMGASQGMGRGMNRPDFADFDTNRDGSISQDELNQYRASKLQQRAAEGRMMRNAANAQPFADIDTNKDGKIDATEFGNHQMQQPRGRNR